MFGIVADYTHNPVAPNDPALLAARLNRWANLHSGLPSGLLVALVAETPLPKAVRDAATVQIIRGQFHENSVAIKYPNEM